MAAKLERFELYKKLTIPVYKVPKSVQETIPISKISKDGIFEVEDKPDGADRTYDKVYVFWDTNYALKDEIQREDFLKLYCKTLNIMNVSYKILTLNLHRDMQKMEEEMFLKHKDKELEAYTHLINDFNAVIQNRVAKGCAGIEQVKMFVISCERHNYANAKVFFRTIEASLRTNFRQMESGLIPLDATERLQYLHRIYRLGKEDKFAFDWDTACKMKRDWRNDICNLAIKEHKDYLEFEDKFVQVMFAKSFPNSLDDNFMTELTAVPFHTITTIDVAPIPKAAASKKLTDMYLSNGRSIEKQQEQRNKAGAYSSEISYDKQQEREEIKGYMDIMRSNDENMFFVGLYVVIIADSLEQMKSHALTIENIGNGQNLTFEPHIWNQLKAFNTSLPIASRQVDTMRTLFTQPLSAMVPFNVQELCESGGIFYGSNKISNNIIVGNRKNLANGNGFILGITGGGKSVSGKLEMTQVCVNTTDDVIVIDPQNEYEGLCEILKGQYINISSATDHFINPLDTNSITTAKDTDAFVADKSQLILSMCEQILDYELSAAQKSIIDRCIRNLYEIHFKEEKKKESPTMKDLYEILKMVNEPEARDLTIALEMFIEGSLNIFAKQTNVNTKNRLVMYGIKDLGKSLAPVGMLVMLESIRARIALNAKKGIATWLYIDEFHNLAAGASAEFLEKIWKEVRKLGGLCTGLTQNVVDLLVSKTVTTMLSNSEFVCLLRQSEPDREALERVLHLNENELAYVRNSETGCGLIKFGEKIIPNDNKLPKDGALYHMVNTNFHEIQANKKKMKPKQIVAAVQGWKDINENDDSLSEDSTIPEEHKLSYDSLN